MRTTPGHCPRRRPRSRLHRRVRHTIGVLGVAAVLTACQPIWKAPAALTVTAVAPTSVDLSWPEPTVDADTVVSSYDIAVDGVVRTTVSGSRRSVQIADLRPSTSYTFSVRARDAKGQPSANALTARTKTTAYPGLAAGTRTVSFGFGGVSRSYVLHVPTTVAAQRKTPVALVIALHGGMGSGTQLAKTSQLDAEADRLGFVVAYPDGRLLTGPGGLTVRTWNGGGCCAPATTADVDDVGFVAAVIRSLSNSTAIDPARVIVGGHSNGAILSWRIACERSDVLSAVVIVEGSLERPACTPSRGVTLTQIHGDNDQLLPLAGGYGTGPSGTNFTSAAASQAMWTTAQHCGTPVASSDVHLSITTWSGCTGATTTKQIIIAGGTHAWAGANPADSADFLGEPSPYYSATAAFSALATPHR